MLTLSQNIICLLKIFGKISVVSKCYFFFLPITVVNVQKVRQKKIVGKASTKKSGENFAGAKTYIVYLS